MTFLLMVWGLIGKIPRIRTIGAVLLAFTIGGIVGGQWATQRALDRTAVLLLDDSAKRQAKNHEELIGYFRDRLKAQRIALEQQEGANKAAYEALQRGKTAADRAVSTARAELARIRKEQDAQPTNSPDPGCVMPPSVRDAIDTAIATINVYPPDAGDDAARTAASVPPRPYTTAPILTCDQLLRGLLDILKAYGTLKADILAEVRRTE